MSSRPGVALGAGATEPISDPWSGEALVERLEELRPALSRILAGFGIPSQDAEDLLQEAVLLFVYKRRRIERPPAWMRGTLRRLCIRYWQRRRWPSTALPTDPASLDALHGRVDTSLASTGERLAVHQALAALRPQHREMVVARYFYGYTADESARIAGYAPTSERQLRRRSLRQMREALRDREGERRSPRPGSGGVPGEG